MGHLYWLQTSASFMQNCSSSFAPNSQRFVQLIIRAAPLPGCVEKRTSNGRNRRTAFRNGGTSCRWFTVFPFLSFKVYNKCALISTIVWIDIGPRASFLSVLLSFLSFQMPRTVAVITTVARMTTVMREGEFVNSVLQNGMRQTDIGVESRLS